MGPWHEMVILLVKMLLYVIVYSYSFCECLGAELAGDGLMEASFSPRELLASHGVYFIG